jgi:hypothetical protein
MPADALRLFVFARHAESAGTPPTAANLAAAARSSTIPVSGILVSSNSSPAPRCTTRSQSPGPCAGNTLNSA